VRRFHTSNQPYCQDFRCSKDPLINKADRFGGGRDPKQPAGDVTVAVEYSTLNPGFVYQQRPLRNWPMVVALQAIVDSLIPTGRATLLSGQRVGKPIGVLG
jgi:hypothetical protein